MKLSLILTTLTCLLLPLLSLQSSPNSLHTNKDSLTFAQSINPPRIDQNINVEAIDLPRRLRVPKTHRFLDTTNLMQCSSPCVSCDYLKLMNVLSAVMVML